MIMMTSRIFSTHNCDSRCEFEHKESGRMIVSIDSMSKNGQGKVKVSKIDPKKSLNPERDDVHSDLGDLFCEKCFF